MSPGRFAIFMVILAALLGLALAAPQPALAQALSVGCTLLNSPAYDFDLSKGRATELPFQFDVGDTVTITAGAPFNLSPTRIQLGTVENPTLFATAPFPGTLVYTFTTATSVPNVLVSVDTGNATVRTSCAHVGTYPATASGQFNHGDELSVTLSERPNIVFQFGNPGSQALTNVRLRCVTGGAATFINQGVSRGPFSAVSMPNPQTLEFSGLASVPRGQNYNVQFSVIPGLGVGQLSDVFCILFGDNFASLSDRLSIRVR
jgi:hypothetical protein